MKGVPWPGLDGGGVPWPGLDGGGYPSQVLMVGGTWGTPNLGWGTTHHQDLVRVPPTTLGWSTPPDLGWGTPHYQDLSGVPPILGWGTPPFTRQSSIVSTYYAAGGMALAFTQEDFLVFRSIGIYSSFSSPSSLLQI